MADDKPNTEKQTRVRKFPIRNFSNLLDSFLKDSSLTDENTIGDLIVAINGELIEHYKS